MTNQDARRTLANLEAAYRDLDPSMLTDDDTIQLVNERIEAIMVAISALKKQDVPDANVEGMISRTKVIDAEGLDEQIRCEMCRNPMHTSRGCDGNCKYDVNLYKRIMQILGERIKPLPLTQPEVAKDINVPTNDCISRRAAIDALVKLANSIDAASLHRYVKHHNLGVLWSGGVSDALEVIEKLPPAQSEQRWTPFVLRPATDEEKEENPGWDYYLDGKLPDNGQKILITVRLPGHEEVQVDEFYSDFDGSYLDGQYEIGTEAIGWMAFPEPMKEDKG